LAEPDAGLARTGGCAVGSEVGAAKAELGVGLALWRVPELEELD
jgi:hypothetical protein